MAIIAIVSAVVAAASAIVWGVARIQRDRILARDRHVQTYGAEPISDPMAWTTTERVRLYDAATRSRLRQRELVMKVAAISVAVSTVVAIGATFAALPQPQDIS